MDPVSDMFIRIKNANSAGLETVQVSYSRFKHDIAKAVSRAGYVGDVEVKGKRVRKVIEIGLQYRNGEPVVRNVKFLSRPSRRIYASYKELRVSPRGGAVFLTTPKGVLTERAAKKEKVGGQLIAEIW